MILDYLRFMLEVGKDHADTFMAELAVHAYWGQFSQPATAPHPEPAARLLSGEL